jgi:acyl-CoA dehydrogenase family protein 9
MALTAAQVAEQKKQVEELLADSDKLGFAKALFFGRFRGDLLFPYPALSPDDRTRADEAAAKVKAFADAHIDHVRIDREARIPDEVVRGLGDLGVLGMTAPAEYGGLGFGQRQYLKTMEVLGGHCCSTAVFVNAHHSIGVRALLLFGTPEQKAKWLPDLMTGRKLAAFALTEPEAGSDAANVRTTADPTPDGTAFVLNGTKHYITNGGIADVLTVMARTPDGKGGSKVTAFLVTPDLPGFEVIEARAEKCGIRGTATGKMRFTNMVVPKANVFGQMGRGLQAALTVLNYGRVTFGATCTGHAKACLKALRDHATTRVQFGQPLAEFQLVQKKAAFAAAHVYAMEAATTQCAAFIDRGADDYMLETAILKVFATEHLWTVVNDTIQVWGGKAYFCDQVLERWMRDARINTIGEGGERRPQGVHRGGRLPGTGRVPEGVAGRPGGRPVEPRQAGRRPRGRGQAGRPVGRPTRRPSRRPAPSWRARRGRWPGRVKRFGTTLPRVFLRLADEATFVQAQLVHERIADIAIDLYVAACVLSRLDAEGAADPAGRYFLALAFRRVEERFAALDSNDDAACLAAATAALGKD